MTLEAQLMHSHPQTLPRFPSYHGLFTRRLQTFVCPQDAANQLARQGGSTPTAVSIHAMGLMSKLWHSFSITRLIRNHIEQCAVIRAVHRCMRGCKMGAACSGQSAHYQNLHAHAHGHSPSASGSPAAGVAGGGAWGAGAACKCGKQGLCPSFVA